MEAGRAMDSLIAEWVMGWKVFVGEPGYGRPPNKLISLVLDTIPPYSTDIAAAWLVVEKVHAGIEPAELGSYQYLTLVCVSAYGDRWAASFDFNLSHDWYEADVIVTCPFAAKAATAPHAICLAALLTLRRF